MINLGHRQRRVLAYLETKAGVAPYDFVLGVACTPLIPVRSGHKVIKRLVVLGWIEQSEEYLRLTPLGWDVVRAWPRKASTAEVVQ